MAWWASALWVVGGYAAATVAWYFLCRLAYRLLGGTGFLTKHTFRDGRTFTVVKGDLGSNLVHKEIYREHCYFRHGVTAERCKPSAGAPKPLVIDCGGNIGLFSAFVAETLPDAEVHLFEPAPLLVEAAVANLQKFGKVTTIVGKDALRKSPTASPYYAYQVALGGAVGEVDFIFNPRTSASSTFVPDALRQRLGGLIAWVRAVYLDAIVAEMVPDFPTRQLCALLAIPIVKYVAFAVLFPVILWHALSVEAGGSGKQKIKAAVVPLSSVLAAQGLRGRPIAMLKIDVEGAEWHVLEGISDEDWPNIQQIVVETHDCGEEHRVEKVKRLLASKGFTSIQEEKEQLQIHDLLSLRTVFAVRR